MSILNLWAIALGGVALAAPLAVHWLTRPRPVAYRLSTIGLLSEVIQQRRARSRIRDWLILALRLLAVALLALALSRPILQSAAMVPATAESGSGRVIVLDVGQSMAAGSGGASSLVQGRSAALGFLEFMPDVEANVILAGAQPRSVFDQLSPNLASLRQSVAEAVARPERTDVRAAMELAGRMLGQRENRKRELIVISDFQRSDWGRLFLESIPEDTQIRLHAVRPAVQDNLAITSVHLDHDPIVGQPAQVDVEVANHSESSAEVRCRVEIGNWGRTLSGSIGPHSSRVLSETVTFESPGWFNGKAHLESNLDVLPDDDERPVAVFVRPVPQVALVTRQGPSVGSRYYLQRALEVALGGAGMPGGPEGVTGAEDSQSRVIPVHPRRDAPSSWPEADLYVIDHPGQLDETAIAHVASRVRRGRGLLYVAADMVDAINLDRLGEQLGSGFEPPVRFEAEGGDGTIRKDLFVRRIEKRQVPFRILGSEVDSAFRPVRFAGGLPTQTVAEGLRDQVLAELSDSSALLYVTGVDAGQVAVLNADLGQSNWPVQPSFVPVLAELVQGLLSGRGATDAAACGEPLVRMLPPRLEREAELVAGTLSGAPPASEDYGQWEWSASQGALVWAWSEPSGPGVYGLRHDGEVTLAVATAAPASESDLQMLEAELLTDRVALGRRVEYSDPASDETDDDDAWYWLIAACLFGLIAEVTALRWFRV